MSRVGSLAVAALLDGLHAALLTGACWLWFSLLSWVTGENLTEMYPWWFWVFLGSFATSSMGHRLLRRKT